MLRWHGNANIRPLPCSAFSPQNSVLWGPQLLLRLLKTQQAAFWGAAYAACRGRKRRSNQNRTSVIGMSDFSLSLCCSASSAKGHACFGCSLALFAFRGVPPAAAFGRPYRPRALQNKHLAAQRGDRRRNVENCQQTAAVTRRRGRGGS